jgi:hypothetical protein
MTNIRFFGNNAYCFIYLKYVVFEIMVMGKKPNNIK